jgi:signal transduction histidine kinase
VSAAATALVIPFPRDADAQEDPATGLRALDGAGTGSRQLPLETRALLALATADEVDEGMARVVELLQRASSARVEWWAAGDDGRLRCAAAAGAARGPRRRFPMGPAGEVVVSGGRRDARLRAVIEEIAPLLRRRCAEERLTRTAVELARRNEALEDFAALVAHDLKAPLLAALVADDPAAQVEQALDLVDSVLDAVGASGHQDDEAAGAPADWLEKAVHDVGAVDVEITSELAASPPLPAAPLRVILRNLLHNAVAAGARRIHVAAVESRGAWRLDVDDDGVGLAPGGDYAAGSGLGLGLCRRIARRHGGVLELVARPAGGTRASLVLGGAA